MFWGYLVVWAMMTIVSFSMAEICSAYPCAGSVYHWSAQLVPEHLSSLWAYITGCFNFMGNAAGDSSFAFSFANFMNSAIQLRNGQVYSVETTVGISIAIVFVWSFICFFRIDQLGIFVILAAVSQIGGIIIIIIAVLVLPAQKSLHADIDVGFYSYYYGANSTLPANAPEYASASYVFTKYYNGTGWSDKSYVVCLGLLTGLFSFAGFEASAHMAEETIGASSNAPRGIIRTVLAAGVTGTCLCLAMLFSTPNVGKALYGPTSNAASNVFVQSCGETWGQALTWIIVINLFFGGVSSVAVTGRITFALFRDRVFPFADFFSQVNPTLQSPIAAILFVAVFDSVIQLLPLNAAGLTAFNAIVGISTVGFQISYAIPILLKVVYNPTTFPLTEHGLGALSIPCGIISSVWLIGSACFFFLPTNYPIQWTGSSSNMNWVFAVVTGLALLATINWQLNSKHHFKGPKRIQETIILDDVHGNPLNPTNLLPLLRSSLNHNEGRDRGQIA
jgi:amino acid transporter